MKVLIVEDSQICQNSLKNICTKLNLEYDCADNGIEAVEFCKNENKYDFILMDMFLPELNGVQATEKIRSLSHGSSYKIILVSGMEEMNEEEAIKQGFDTFVKKPLSIKILEELVEKFK